jgi:predicted amidohydrolase YtcJ
MHPDALPSIMRLSVYTPGMTINPAYASFSEDVLGSLEIGKRADYVVLSQDIMRIPTNAILHTVVEATVIDGRVAYGKV